MAAWVMGDFIRTLIVIGLFINAMFLSGYRQFMRKIFETLDYRIMKEKCGIGPVYVRLIQPIALSVCVVGLVSQGMYYYEARGEYSIEKPGTAAYEKAKAEMLGAACEFAWCIMAIIVWGIAMRLKHLHEKKLLRGPRPPAFSGQEMPEAKKKKWFIIAAIVAVCCADIPICRLHYTALIHLKVTLPKQQVNEWIKGTDCHQVFMDSTRDDGINPTAGKCGEFCGKVKTIAKARDSVKYHVRRLHPMGGIAAVLFDGTRGGGKNTNTLLAKKDCQQLLKSADRPNPLVSLTCFASAAVAVTVVVVAVNNLLAGDPAEEGTPHQD